VHILKGARWLILATCLLIVFSDKSFAEDSSYSSMGSSDDIRILVERAHIQQISMSPQWLALLYYEKKGDGYQSSISDPKFFLTDGGRHSPEKELDAMLRGIRVADNNAGGLLFCRFPARARFLQKELGFKEAGDYEICPWYDIGRGIENSSEVKLVFPAPQPRGPGAIHFIKCI
jgi:hypothetical protein